MMMMMIIITRLHVGCIPNVNTNLVNMWKSENFHDKVIRRRFIFHTIGFASILEVYDVTSLQ